MSSTKTDKVTARVRVLEEIRCRNTDYHSVWYTKDRIFEPGEIVHVVRWKNSRDDVWATSYDIDGALFLPAEKVEVLGRSANWDPLPGSYAWDHATDEERAFWTAERRAWMNAPEGDGPRSMSDYPDEEAR